MRLVSRLLPAAVLALGSMAVMPTATVGQARDGITAEAIRGHLYFLAHDALTGRAPGSPGGRIAAEYIAGRFMAAGLRPVDGSFFQEVPLTGVTLDAAASTLTFQHQDRRVRGSIHENVMLWAGEGHGRVEVDGELVFVGFGADAPDWRWNDYKDRDLEGRILLFLVGDPPAPPEEPDLFDGRALTYYGRWTYKLEEARRRGAAGAMLVHTEASAGYPWSVVRTSWAGEQLLPGDRPAGEGSGQPLMNAWVTRDLARALLAMGGLDLDELSVQATRRDFRPVATGIEVRGRLESRVREVSTRNVVGYIPGQDDEVGDEVVVLTAHHDHLGIGPAVDGDSIYNGAYDNASGVALLLEVAAAFGRVEAGPRRGLLFMATAAEEAGLLGSGHYVRRPLFPLESTVAALNVDGANLWGETQDVVAIGADRSTLGDVLGRHAEEMGLVVMPDGAPERGSLYRSDHFPFAREGVPVLSVQHGLRFRGQPPQWGQRVMGDYLATRYHAPGDEYDPTFPLTGAVQQARLLFDVTRDLADSTETPEWYPEGRLRGPWAGR